MQDFTDTVFTRSEQHKEAMPSRMERDRTDTAKLATKLEKHSPFSEEKALRNIITGTNADTDEMCKTCLVQAKRQSHIWKDKPSFLILHLQTEG